MALTDIEFVRRNPDSVVIKGIFPDLKSVQEKLLPTAIERRVAIEDYRKSLKLRGRLTPAVEESIEKAARVRSSIAAIIYIAGPLTDMDEQTKERYGDVSQFFESYGETEDGRRKFFAYVPHLHGTDPKKHPNVTPDEVRDIDHLWAVVVADACVNFFDPTAHGNAIEEGWQEDHMIPSTFQSPDDKILSRLVLGMNNIQELQKYPGNFEIEDAKGLKILADEYSTWLDTFPDRDPREFFYMSPKYLANPSLRLAGYDPSQFNPVFAVDQYLAYIKDPKHPCYGQVGVVEAHDWREYGMYHIKFPDGKTEYFPDDSKPSQVSFWLR